MLNNGDLILINKDIYLWTMVEMQSSKKYTPKAIIENKLATILYPHQTEPDWYYIFLHKAVNMRMRSWSPSTNVWSGWVYLNWERYEQNNFDIVAGSQDVS